MKKKSKIILLLHILLGIAPIFGQDSNRVLSSGDIISIKVAEEVEMTQRITIPNDGLVTFWLLDPIVVTNRTVAEVRNALYTILDKDYIIKPAISVEVEVYSKKFINLVGSFVIPGRKELPSEQRIDIIDAFAIASGFSPRANLKKIILRRNGQPTIYSKKELEALYKNGKRIFVEADDTIEVEESIF